MKYVEVISVSVASITLLATIIMLVFAIIAIMKEFQLGRIRKTIDTLETDVRKGIRIIESSARIEEVCSAFVDDNSADSVFDYQKIKVNLYKLIRTRNEEEIISAVLTLNSYARNENPKYKQRLKYFYIELWHDKKFHESNVADEFSIEYKRTFHESIFHMRL